MALPVLLYSLSNYMPVHIRPSSNMKQKLSAASLPLQFQSQPTGFGKRCCQPVTAVQPVATGVGMPVTSQCPPHHPHLFPMMPTRTSCSRPRLTMSVRTSQRARTSCLRTPYLESERWGGVYKQTLVRKRKESIYWIISDTEQYIYITDCTTH